MKLTKYGKALLMGAMTAGAALGITSCVTDYSVGFLYVTGTQTSSTSGQGIISGYKIAHNTGQLTSISGLPVASGGANPIRAVLLGGSRFLYVLNRGTTASGGSDCTTADPCQNSNITLFSVGANGILSEQATYYSQGTNPFRMFVDSTSTFLYVLDHDAPDSSTSSTTNSCYTMLSASACGDITAFKIDSDNGRLSVISNSALTTSTGTQYTYFPVPANPVDVVMASSTILTLSGTSSTSFPYSGGATVFPYTYTSSSGQLSITSSGTQSLGISAGNAIVYAGSYIYVLDNENTEVGSTYASQIIPYTLGSNSQLQAQTGGAVAIYETLSNPTSMVVEAKGKWAYVAAAGSTSSSTASSGISAYVIDSSTKQLSVMSGSPFGSGSGPRCIVEDPSDQFIYTVNYNDSNITGRSIDESAGVLNKMSGSSQWQLNGPPTWCVMDGRTD